MFDHAWQALDGSWFGGQDSFRSCWQEVVVATKGWGMHGGLGSGERIVLEDDEKELFAQRVTYADAVLRCKREAAAMCGIQDCVRAAGIRDGPTYGSGGSGNTDLGGRGKGTMSRTSARSAATPQMVPGKIICEGDLTREEIQRVIAPVMGQIKYCYEKELNKAPNLEGRLVMFWLISGSGDVQTASASENTFSDPPAAPIERCVTRIIQRLKFPSLEGGVVNVTYPLMFSMAGADEEDS